MSCILKYRSKWQQLPVLEGEGTMNDRRRMLRLQVSRRKVCDRISYTSKTAMCRMSSSTTPTVKTTLQPGELAMQLSALHPVGCAKALEIIFHAVSVILHPPGNERVKISYAKVFLHLKHVSSLAHTLGTWGPRRSLQDKLTSTTK